MIHLVKVENKVRVSKKDYTIFTAPPALYSGGIGVMFPADMVVLDVDSKSGCSKYYIDWIKKEFPNILITKTPSEGGYHIFFKTNKRIKRLIGMTSIFGWKIDVLSGTNNYITMPDNQNDRAYVNGGFNNVIDLCNRWDGYDVVINDINDVCPFVDSDPNHPSPLQLTDGNRNSGMLEWLGYFCAKGVKPEVMAKFVDVFSDITTLPTQELLSTVLSSLSKYVSGETTDVDTAVVFRGGSYMDLATQLRDYIKDTGCIQFDSATGLGHCIVGGIKHDKLTIKAMLTKMTLLFGDKMSLVKRDDDGMMKGIRNVPSSDRDAIFSQVLSEITTDSRHEMYERIPKWDGVERINTFMKKYYLCDSNPNFFWLFVTSLVGMMDNPHKVYVPYFFDFVSSAKGVGKTYLLTRLSGGRYTFMSKGRSTDDVYVNAYSNNSLILIDDECLMTDADNGEARYEWWKQFVTAKQDTFSRKNQQPETHDRAFICCRTSNRAKTGHVADERRQIIFESTLGKDDCRIIDLPDSFFEQLLAEAKVYYDKYGVYKLSDEDRMCVRVQQAQYYDTEKECYIDVNDYINWARTKYLSGYRDENYWNCLLIHPQLKYGVGINWRTYRAWAQYYNKKIFAGMTFWQCVDAIAVRTCICEKRSAVQMVFDKEIEPYANLIPNDADVQAINMDIVTNKVSVSELFDKSKDEMAQEMITSFESNKSRMDELATELGVKTPLIDGKDSYEKYGFNSYDMPSISKYLPKALVKFFDDHKNKPDSIVPTPIQVADGLTITYGLGGAHYAVPDSSFDNVIHADVNSMYPNIMLEYNLLSRAVKEPRLFREIVEDRLHAKAEGKKEMADRLKLKINSVYGLMKANWSALYDPHNANSITVLGQMAITWLALMLKAVGATIININTDGIMYVPTDKTDIACNEWQKQTRLKLSFKHYKHVEQKDVNNYMAIDDDDVEIRKGAKYKIKNT